MRKVRESHVGLGLEGEGEIPWALRVRASHFSDGPERLSVNARVEFPLLGPLRGLVRTWSFYQNERSFLYFGPKRYSEHELLVVVRPLARRSPLRIEVRLGPEWALGERAYGFRRLGDPGFVGELNLEHETRGRVHLGARAFVDRLRTDSPYSGHGAEAWLELIF